MAAHGKAGNKKLGKAMSDAIQAELDTKNNYDPNAESASQRVEAVYDEVYYKTSNGRYSSVSRHIDYVKSGKLRDGIDYVHSNEPNGFEDNEDFWNYVEEFNRFVAPEGWTEEDVFDFMNEQSKNAEIDEGNIYDWKYFKDEDFEENRSSYIRF